ncbi:MAG: hypothetical protein ABI609_03630 [Acidobacteriota bacterium]
MTRYPAGSRLHIGSGNKRLEGWVNVDFQDIPGVDVVADVTKGLKFENASAVFAEHFLEHLFVTDAIAFLLEAHRVLAPGAWIRLSTPNLDWVWATHYRQKATAEEKREMAIAANRAFHGWGHQFIWNPEFLDETLTSCGFAPVRACDYGESALEVFRGIERHEQYKDEPGLPHVIIREAQKSAPQPARLAALRAQIHEQFLNHLHG